MRRRFTIYLIYFYNILRTPHLIFRLIDAELDVRITKKLSTLKLHTDTGTKQTLEYCATIFYQNNLLRDVLVV
jgi:hypothetical protein